MILVPADKLWDNESEVVKLLDEDSEVFTKQVRLQVLVIWPITTFWYCPYNILQVCLQFNT